MRTATIAIVLALAVPPLAAQDSPFGIRGLGVPGRLESVRSRSTGGAFAAFDPQSALDEASIAGATRLTATTAGAASRMSDDLAGTPATRRTARFPLLQVYGTTWADVPAQVASPATPNTRISDGGVSDLRFVVARRMSTHLFIGAGFHILSGSTRVSAERSFTDTSKYRPSGESQEIAYDGVGFSSSALLSIGHSGALQLAAYWRSDSRLRGQVGKGTTVSSNDLPMMAGGALRFRLAPQAVLGASLTYRNWSVSADSNAYNTTNWSAGLLTIQAGVEECGGKDHVCGNEETYYPPLTDVQATPAFTELASFQGDGLNLKWENTGTRSAFIGSFSR